MSYVGAGALELRNLSTVDEKLFLSELELRRSQDGPGLAELLLWDNKIPALKMKICFCRNWCSNVPRRISGVAAFGLHNPSTVDENLFLSELVLQRPQD